ncbi:Tetraspanin family protein [Entamoeba marina]
MITFSTCSKIQIIFTTLLLALEGYTFYYCHSVIYNKDIILPEKYSLVYFHPALIAAMIFTIPSFLTGILQSKIAAIFAIVFDIISIAVLFILYLITQIFYVGLSNMSEDDEMKTVQYEANCCGWKVFNTTNCSAPSIETAKTCFEIVGEPFMKSVKFAADMDAYIMKSIVLVICVTIVFLIFHKNNQKTKEN